MLSSVSLGGQAQGAPRGGYHEDQEVGIVGERLREEDVL